VPGEVVTSPREIRGELERSVDPGVLSSQRVRESSSGENAATPRPTATSATAPGGPRPFRHLLGEPLEARA